ncbi:methyltransferase family protein [Streptomyces sp. S186]|uniref:methyltransferase family protein n=1 Tax=Streptomyces sp. S186 TaxID=3434395 RepID=UPI003F666A35
MLDNAEVPRPLIEAHLGSLLARVLVVTAELRLMDRLAEKPLTAGELAHRLHLDCGALTRVLNVLEAAGYVVDVGGGPGREKRFAPTGTSRRWLVSDRPGSVVDYLELLPYNEWKWAEPIRPDGKARRMPQQSRRKAVAALPERHAGAGRA